MCSCVDAFDELRACSIVVVGVAGSLPIHGVGTAIFRVTDSLGDEIILKIHNCLLCTSIREEETFNLISVSQMLRTRQSSVSFNADNAEIRLKHLRRKQEIVLNLVKNDGLYSLDMSPVSARDGI